MAIRPVALMSWRAILHAKTSFS